tara:strand:- start:26 stop:283 length:258 start_codon:yes stop_codon:yes gene_type:complete
MNENDFFVENMKKTINFLQKEIKELKVALHKEKTERRLQCRELSLYMNKLEKAYSNGLLQQDDSLLDDTEETPFKDMFSKGFNCS